MPRWRIGIVVLALIMGQMALTNVAFGAENVPFKGSDQWFPTPGGVWAAAWRSCSTGPATRAASCASRATECFDAVSGDRRLCDPDRGNGDTITRTYQAGVSVTADPDVITYQEEQADRRHGALRSATARPGCRCRRSTRWPYGPDVDRSGVETGRDLDLGRTHIERSEHGGSGVTSRLERTLRARAAALRSTIVVPRRSDDEAAVGGRRSSQPRLSLVRWRRGGDARRANGAQLRLSHWSDRQDRDPTASGRGEALVTVQPTLARNMTISDVLRRTNASPARQLAEHTRTGAPGFPSWLELWDWPAAAG